ncbi:MAG TPA: anhydro-N-acetylmuramic acid kinase [Gammaproteobacteria bacterium]|nr:anhydro-N-acetylmuramic acid kinase [Gammaproteobacteria bacterium]
MAELFIGLISGTSMDGVDAALLDCSTPHPQVIATHAGAYSAELRRQLDAALLLENPLAVDLDELDTAVGEAFASAANALLAHAAVEPGAVTAIGSHGQTIRHEPNAPAPYSLQIGAPRAISRLTGIDVVADFRTADIEAGGQGAPLVPAFHQAVFTDARETRVILNIGGIANITILPGADSDQAVRGFDTGPGNTLMDIWAVRHLATRMDTDGRWAASGHVNAALLEALLDDPYFRLPPPKSTGREYFNAGWLSAHLQDSRCPAQDIQATLCELTACSISRDILAHAASAQRVLVCGGGVHNPQLMKRLVTGLPGMTVASTAACGLDPDWVEAATFAWLAQQHLSARPGNIPAVTGAGRAVVLGRLFRH